MTVLDQLRSLAGLFAAAFLCSLLIGKLISRTAAAEGGKKRLPAPPQPSRALPIIGHLDLLRNREKPLYNLLGDLADKCGPVFMLRLGMNPTLIVSGWEAAKDCLATHDKVLASRPTYAAGKHLGYDFSMMGFAPYGAYWRTVRKIATIELLSNARIEMFKHIRSAEVDICLRDLYGLCKTGPGTTDLKQCLGDLTYNVVINIVSGKRYFGTSGSSNEAWRFWAAVGQLFSLLSAFVPSDLFPFLSLFGLSANERRMQSAARELDILMSGLLDEHRQKRLSGERKNVDSDFMDVMISLIADDPELTRGFDSDIVIKSTSLAIILGGADTTSLSMILALAALLNNREALRKVYQELDMHIGRERLVEESDIKKLVYFQAVVKEVLRLYPPSQLLVPHEAMEDCQVGGYHVPRGTRVLVNMWKLQRDANVWENPLEFRPERFLASGIDIRGQNLEFIPFGAGRRACPGISFAMQVVHITLARLLQAFELDTPGGVPVDMNPGLGMTADKSAGLQAVLTPRLAARLYEG